MFLGFILFSDPSVHRPDKRALRSHAMHNNATRALVRLHRDHPPTYLPTLSYLTIYLSTNLHILRQRALHVSGNVLLFKLLNSEVPVCK